MPKAPKVVVVGIDGAGLDVILPLVAAGKTPGLARCLSEGISGPLQSVIPTISAAAWTSLYTGVSPGKHGVHDFINRVAGQYAFKMATAQDRRRKPIWSLLSGLGKRVCVIGGTLTYPPDAVHGIMLAGLGTPCIGGYPSQADYATPESIDREITEKIGRFRIGPIVSSQHFADKVRYASEIKEAMLSAVAYRNRLHEYLLQREDYDFCFFFYGESDVASHLFWHEPQFVKQIYEAIDPFILKLASMEDVHLIVASDHGFGPCNRLFNLRKWLEDEGLSHRRHSLFDAAKTKARRLLGRPVDGLSDVDWPSTRAFSGGSTAGGIFLNMRGREAQGVVAPEEVERFCQDVADRLLRTKDPQFGQAVVDQVIMGRDEFHGETADFAPDMVPLFKPGYAVGLRTNRRVHHDENLLFSDSSYWSGDHVLQGIFLAKGEHFKRGESIQGAKIIDVAPSLLHLLGVPIPRDMDGQVLKAAFTDAFLSAAPVTLSDSDLSQSSGQSDISDEDKKSMADALRSLGYIE